MALLALEINDAGLVVRRDGESSVVAESPGYALIEEGGLLTGEAAWTRARLRPRRVDHRFWSELDTAPLPPPFGGGVSRADLAHAHLASVWSETGSRDDAAILALPGTCSENHLGLVLGIAQACGIRVRGLVDAAVAACAGLDPPPAGAGSDLLHVDLGLHSVVVTDLSRGPELVRRDVKSSPHAGLVSLRDAWVKRIAELFVRTTRFDPLHAAATEQALYDRMPALLAALREGERVTVDLDAAGKRHAVELTRRELTAAVEPHYEAILRLVGVLKRAGRPATIVLSERASRLPDLAERLATIGDAVTLELERGAAASGALRHRDAIVSDEAAPVFVTRLPLTAGDEPTMAPQIGPPGTDRHGGAGGPTGVVGQTGVAGPTGAGGRTGAGAVATAAPTHLVHEGSAWPIGTEPLVLGTDVPEDRRRICLFGSTAGISRTHCSVYARKGRVLVEDHSRYGSFLNGQRVAGRADLAAGDRLRLGGPGVEVLLIRVVDEDGTA